MYHLVLLMSLSKVRSIETTMTSSSTPIKRRQFVDRLSELPDSLLVRILSFLELKQTVITTVLSKRWQFLWTQYPRFVFNDCSRTTEKIREFISSVHRILVNCGRNCSETFKVNFSYGNGFSLDVDAWVNFAFRNKVEQFSLTLNSSYSDDLYTLPEIDSRSLHELAVFDGVADESLLHISAPYLHSLGIIYLQGRKLHLDNISSLVRAIIGFNGNLVNNSVDMMNNVKEILENIRHVKVLEMRGFYAEVVSWLAVNGYQFPQSTRTYLIVEAPKEKLSIHGIVGLLESSPKLETLVVQGHDFHVEHRSCPDPKGDLHRDLVDLKTITIKDFINPNLSWEPLLTLTPILLKKATKLRKLVVDIEGIYTCALCDRLNIAQTLLSCPRSSKEAVVIFK